MKTKITKNMTTQKKKNYNAIKEFFEKKYNVDLSSRLQLLTNMHLNNNSISEDSEIDSLLKLFEFESIPEKGGDIEGLIGDLSANVLSNSVNTGSPYFIGHMTSLLPNFIRPIAEFTAAINQNMVKVETSKAVTLYERKALAMLHELIYGNSKEFYCAHIHNAESTLGIITSGGTIANITALQCARNSSLNVESTDVEKFGLPHALLKNKMKRQVVLCSQFAHYSVKKAMGLLGLGTSNVLTIETDEKNKLKISDLQEKLEYCKYEDLTVCAIIGVAGSTECGAIDPLSEMADLAEKYEVYFHVDAAWGGAIQFSNKYKNLLQGIERADSVTLDGHKQLYLPMGIGMILFKDPKMASIIEKHSEYIIRKGSFDLGKRSIEGSRPAKVFYLQTALNLLGRKGYEELINYGIDNAKKMQKIIEGYPDFELLTFPETNILLYRYLPEKFRNGINNTNDVNRQISDFNIVLQKRQFKKGKSFVSRTALVIPNHGTEPICALRVVLANPLITEKHIFEILNEQLLLAKTIESEIPLI